MEMILKPHKGGGNVNVYRKGGAPESVVKALEESKVVEDEERQQQEGAMRQAKEEKQADELQGIAKSETLFTWNRVSYTIPVKGGKRVLLSDVQGYVKPGRLTALMGGNSPLHRVLTVESGAGKTTLLNCLAQRVSTGVITGEMLIDGRPLPKSFQRSTGYVEQLDVHEPTSTVREALRFSALLRQPKEVPREEKYDYVEKIIKLLEMEEIAEAIIGGGEAGLSVEQRKRVTIGVELASKPQLLLFLDEPTSGMSAMGVTDVRS
jgi:ABC-type multidrug transport system ATPase subunit